MSVEGMLYRLVALLVAIVGHEFAHARVSDLLGDPTPRQTGRLTLNPMAHLDALGLITLWLFGFGWARPVEINPYYYRDRRRGTLLVSLAGPGMNVLLALAALLVIKAAGIPLRRGFAGEALFWILQYNLWLSVFNLIPVPPLDGSKILMSLLPGQQSLFFARLEPQGWIILLLLIWTGLIGAIMRPLALVLWGALDIASNLLLLRPFL